MKVRIDKWVTVASWKWDIKETACTICQEPFEKPCPNCTYAGDDCSIIKGECGHHFHMHCIYKWLLTSNQKVCPLDRREWKEDIYTVTSESSRPQIQFASLGSNQNPQNRNLYRNNRGAQQFANGQNIVESGTGFMMRQAPSGGQPVQTHSQGVGPSGNGRSAMNQSMSDEEDGDRAEDFRINLNNAEMP